jgi:uroporphyrinogen-III synthase
VELLGKDDAPRIMKGIVAASIGPVTAETAQALGIESSVIPEEYTIPALVESLAGYFQRSKRLRLQADREA